jgi:hypothetical protein
VHDLADEGGEEGHPGRHEKLGLALHGQVDEASQHALQRGGHRASQRGRPPERGDTVHARRGSHQESEDRAPQQAGENGPDRPGVHDCLPTDHRYPEVVAEDGDAREDEVEADLAAGLRPVGHERPEGR